MDRLAYQLFWDLRHIKGTVYDATLVSFEGAEYITGWIGFEPCSVPETILFEADFKVAHCSDFPSNDVNWPLMSPRMLKVLHAVGTFPHRLIPVQLIDRKALGANRYLPNGDLRPEVIDDQFAAVQLTKHVDVVDWERSIFRNDRLGTEDFYHFDKLALRTPAGGLPPLFRLSMYEHLLLVSAEARQALEAAGIRGVQFLDLPGTSQYKQD